MDIENYKYNDDIYYNYDDDNYDDDDDDDDRKERGALSAVIWKLSLTPKYQGMPAQGASVIHSHHCHHHHHQALAYTLSELSQNTISWLPPTHANVCAMCTKVSLIPLQHTQLDKIIRSKRWSNQTY